MGALTTFPYKLRPPQKKLRHGLATPMSSCIVPVGPTLFTVTLAMVCSVQSAKMNGHPAIIVSPTEELSPEKLSPNNSHNQLVQVCR